MQAKNLADSAAQIPTLERYVFSSMANASKWSHGKFSRLYHMDSKALAVDYALTLPGLQGKFSQIQAAIYYNLPWEWGLPTTPQKVSSPRRMLVGSRTEKQQQNDGSYNITAIGSGDAPLPFLDVHRDFGSCVQTVVNAAPGVNFFAVSEMLSWNQYLATWCQSQGVPRGKYNQVSLEKFEELLPGGLGREFGENVLFAQQFGYEGGDPVVRPREVIIAFPLFMTLS